MNTRSRVFIIAFFRLTFTHRWIIRNIITFITILCTNSGSSKRLKNLQNQTKFMFRINLLVLIPYLFRRKIFNIEIGKTIHRFAFRVVISNQSEARKDNQITMWHQCTFELQIYSFDVRSDIVDKWHHLQCYGFTSSYHDERLTDKEVVILFVTCKGLNLIWTSLSGRN